MPKPTVIINIDDLLMPSSSVADKGRGLVLPAPTKRLIEILNDRGIHCLFISAAMPTANISTMFQQLGVTVNINNIYSSNCELLQRDGLSPELMRLIILFQQAGDDRFPEKKRTIKECLELQNKKYLVEMLSKKAAIADAWLKVNVPNYMPGEVLFMDNDSDQCIASRGKGFYTIEVNKNTAVAQSSRQSSDIPTYFSDIVIWVDKTCFQQSLHLFFRLTHRNDAVNIKNKTMHRLLSEGAQSQESDIAFLERIAAAATKAKNLSAFFTTKMPTKSNSTAATLNQINKAVQKHDWAAAYLKIDSLMKRLQMNNPDNDAANDIIGLDQPLNLQSSTSSSVTKTGETLDKKVLLLASASTAIEAHIAKQEQSNINLQEERTRNAIEDFVKQSLKPGANHPELLKTFSLTMKFFFKPTTIASAIAFIESDVIPLIEGVMGRVAIDATAHNDDAETVATTSIDKTAAADIATDATANVATDDASAEESDDDTILKTRPRSITR